MVAFLSAKKEEEQASSNLILVFICLRKALMTSLTSTLFLNRIRR